MRPVDLKVETPVKREVLCDVEGTLEFKSKTSCGCDEDLDEAFLLINTSKGPVKICIDLLSVQSSGQYRILLEKIS